MTDRSANHVKGFSVDFNAMAGAIRPLHGINLGPWLWNGAFDASEYFQRLRIPSVRLHDCPWMMPDVGDMHCVFPLSHADPADPRNYVFGPTDDYLLSVKNVGANIKYRLGESAEMRPASGTRRQFLNAPQNHEAWAEAALQIVKHYNDGWADGFHHGIKYWEIWNEPWAGSPQPGAPTGFWNDTPEAFFRFYRTVALKLKTYDPSLKVGAGLCGADWNEDFSNSFLTFCRETNTPFDYHAWHQYGPHPAYVARHARNVRRQMDRHGFAHAELHMDEWAPHFQLDFGYTVNMPVHAPGQIPRIQGMEGATLVATVLCWLQDLPVDVGNYYWAGQGLWGLLDHWFRPTKIYEAFSAFVELYNLGQRVQAAGGEEETGEGILAAVAEDKRSAAILISRFQGWQCEMDLRLDGLPTTGAVAEFYQLGNGMYPEPVRTEKIDGPSTTLCNILVAPDVLLVKLRFDD
jgi:hypothetical protein